jgi:hypothetical protein
MLARSAALRLPENIEVVTESAPLLVMRIPSLGFWIFGVGLPPWFLAQTVTGLLFFCGALSVTAVRWGAGVTGGKLCVLFGFDAPPFVGRLGVADWSIG